MPSLHPSPARPAPRPCPSLDPAEAERRRIGAELHDGLGQHLCGLANLATVLRNQLELAGSPYAGSARELARLAAAAVDLTRQTAHGLYPQGLEHDGLVPALAGLAEQVSRAHCVDCDFQDEGLAPPVGPRAALHVFRIAQEAIHNAVRHGLADRIAVRLGRDGSTGRLIVEDNGRGFGPAGARRGGGLGIALMRRRAALVGGALRLHGRMLKGVLLECTFALSGAADET